MNAFADSGKTNPNKANFKTSPLRPEKAAISQNAKKRVSQKFSSRIFGVYQLLIVEALQYGDLYVLSDAELVKACLDGEKAAFEALVKRYERLVRAVALDVLGDYHGAADVSQEAFVTAYQKLPALRRASAFGPWLMKITKRCALDLANRGQKEQQRQMAIGAAAENPDGRLDEHKHRLLAAVLKLPKGEKQVVMLRYFAGHSVKGVADAVGRSVGTVTKQLSRARVRLRTILKEY